MENHIENIMKHQINYSHLKEAKEEIAVRDSGVIHENIQTIPGTIIDKSNEFSEQVYGYIRNNEYQNLILLL